MARIICVKPCVPATDLSVTIPFVGAVKPIVNIDLTSDCSGCGILSSLFLQINPFIMSLGIPICVLGCIVSLISVVKAIPDTLGPPPDPTKLISAIAKMVSSCECVVQSAIPPPAGLICQFIQLIYGLLQALQSVLTCITGLLGHIVTLNARSSALMADPNVVFQTVGKCLNTEAVQLQAAVLAKFGGISVLFAALGPVFTLISTVFPIPELAQIATAFDTFSGSTSGNPPTAQVLTALDQLNSDIAVVVEAVGIAAELCP